MLSKINTLSILKYVPLYSIQESEKMMSFAQYIQDNYDVKTSDLCQPLLTCWSLDNKFTMPLIPE